MKLDKRQISALADSFYKEIKPKIHKENEANRIKQLQKFKPDYEKGLKILQGNKFIKTISIDIGKNYQVELTRTKTFESYTGSYPFRYLIDDVKSIDKSDIERDIVLATIDSSSVDDIMKFLKNKYK